VTDRDGDADEVGQFGAAGALAAIGERLPPLRLLGWALVLVGALVLAVGALLPSNPLAVLGALVALPGATALVFGYGRGALGVDTQ
jgi:vacuolar-type H+-ATPase subunit I/STV1